MEGVFFKSFIGASLVYITYHLLGFIPLFPSGALFELASMLTYFYALPFFALGNAVTYLLIKRKINKWNIPINFFLLFVFVNLLFGRIPLNDTVTVGDPPFSNDFFYWVRWSLAMMPLFLLDFIFNRLTNVQRLVLVFSPFLFITIIIVALSYGP